MPVWGGNKNVGVRGIAFGRCGDLIWKKDQGGILPLLAAAKAGYRSKAGLHSAVFLPNVLCSQHFFTRCRGPYSALHAERQCSD